MNTINTSAISCALSLLLAAGSLSAQTVKGTNIADIPNNANGTDPFAGGARVTHTVNTGAAKDVRDFHVCVGETTVANSERRTEGDPHNDNYRAGPNVPNGWVYRGIQRGTTTRDTTVWCVTWVRGDNEAPNTQLSFEFDYRGPSTRLKLNPKAVIFTSDGNNSAADAPIGKPDRGVTPLSMNDPDAEQRPTATLWLSLAALLLALIAVLGLGRRRGAPPPSHSPVGERESKAQPSG